MGEGARTGRCLCGGVSYEVIWPPAAIVACHCTDCQKQSGSALSLVGVCARDAISVEGALQTYDRPGTSGQIVSRLFCGTCGSPILTDTPAAREQGIIFFKAGSLDQTADIAPTVHYWTRSAQHWFELPEGVTTFEQQ